MIYYTEKGFENWLIESGCSVAFIRNELGRLKRLNNIYDTETEFANDKCANMLDDLSYYKYIKNNSRKSHELKRTLENYVKFLESATPNTRRCVAKFIGNYEGFYSYVNTKYSKAIYDLTRLNKMKGNKCECSYCGKTVEHLEVAHIKKLSRPDIIKSILDKKYKTKNNLYEVDLVEFEKDFKNEHFIYLCHECHQKYDDNKITEDMMQSKVLNNIK